jgi:hypothetical protein
MDRRVTLKLSSRIIAVYLGPSTGRADRSCESADDEVLPHESCFSSSSWSPHLGSFSAIAILPCALKSWTSRRGLR